MYEHGHREVWADACRIVAIFGVILIHTAAPVFYEYRSYTKDFFWVANFIHSFAEVSTSLFVMVSGALLLDVRELKDKFWRKGIKRILRITIPLIFWSLVYEQWLNYWKGQEFNVLNFFNHMIHEPVMYHLWFVYMITGVYLIIPILRLISNELIVNNKFALYFFMVWFLINTVTVYYPLHLLNILNLPGFLAWPGYFILGYYLARSNYYKNYSRKILALIYFVTSISTSFLTHIFNYSSLNPNVTAYSHFSPNVVIASIAAFLWLRKSKIPQPFAKPLAYISGLIFPVYFMHLLVIELLKAGILGISITSYSIHPAIGIPTLATSTFIISLIIAAACRIIPYSKQIIG